MSAMRNARSKPSPGWPMGHSGWCFSGLTAFESSVASFLARGAARRERLMYVADDPHPEAWPNELIERGDLLIVSTAEAYGTERTVDAATQLSILDAALSEALREGYTGICSAADVTSLIAGPARLAAWLSWEEAGDRFIARNPVTAICAFDRTRVDAESLRAVMDVHDVRCPASDWGDPAGGDPAGGDPGWGDPAGGDPGWGDPASDPDIATNPVNASRLARKVLLALGECEL